MRRVPPSMLVREELKCLLAEGVDREANIVSSLVETVTRLVVQELLEGEQADALGAEAATSDETPASGDYATATSVGGSAPRKGPSTSAFPR